MPVTPGVYFRQQVDVPLPTWGHGRRSRFWVKEFTMGHGIHEMSPATQVLGDPALAFGR